MTRKERRTAEHLARKAAYKAMKQNPAASALPAAADEIITEAPAPAPVVVPIPEAQTQPEISEARLTANRANALLSTGPKTEAGKATCSHNAVKTALTGQTVLLPADDLDAYQRLGQRLIAKHQPATPDEQLLVQSIIDSQWRLIRIPTLEFGIQARGREELAPSVPAHLLEIEVHLKYERSLKNLNIQECRIRRNREKDLKALAELQSARKEKEAAAKRLAQLKAELRQQPQPPQELTPPLPAAAPSAGFEFESPENLAETAVRNAA